MKVLIIDDEADTRMLLSDMLENFNWKLHEAEDCKVGLEKLKSDPDFKLALVDWRTPHMSGLEFLQNIRKDPSLKNMIVIMITGLNDLEYVSQALGAGVNEYLMKPFTQDMILDKLKLAGVDLQ